MILAFAVVLSATPENQLSVGEGEDTDTTTSEWALQGTFMSFIKQLSYFSIKFRGDYVRFSFIHQARHVM